MNRPIFNWTYYYSALLLGYRYWRFTNYQTFTVVEPVREPIEIPDSYVVHFTDREILECADGIDDCIILYNDVLQQST
jgi:hypothetical protein